MRKKRTSPAISYLLEFVIALLFFALSSVIIITLFSHADTKKTYSIDTNNAVLIAQSVVAEFKNQDTIMLHGSQSYSEEITKQEAGAYIAKWSIESSDLLYEGILEIWKDDICILRYPFGLEYKEGSL